MTYNFFRQGWIVERVAAMAETVFGCQPVVISLPYLETLGSSAHAGFTMIVAGCNRRIAEEFSRRDAFWLHVLPGRNMAVDGFAVRPQQIPPGQRDDWQRIAPTRLAYDEGAPILASDDWPFLYLRGRLIPDLSIRSVIVLGGLGVVLLYLFLPKGRLQIDGRMFFLGAGFMLLETRAVVQLALLFGGTWLVNSLVFFAVLTLVLLANLYVLEAPAIRLGWHYGGLLVVPGGQRDGSPRRVRGRGTAVALRRSLWAGARSDVLRRRHLRPFVP